MPLRALAALALLLPVAFAAPATAGGTKVFRVTSYKDFDEGEAQSVLLSSTGEARTGYGARRVDLPVAQVFSAVTAPDGRVWLGTGDEAVVYSWGGGGKEPEKACRLDGVLVTAMAAGRDGTVYAGTLPGGKVWEVKPGRAGAPAACRELARLDGADQVFALSLDEARRTLYAATGPNGKLYALDLPSGHARLFWDSGEKHLLALARDGATLLAGSADEAILYRVSADGTAHAVQDFAGDEVRAIALGPDGAIYVAVNEFEKKGAATGAPPPPGKPHGIKMVLPSAAVAAPSVVPPGRERKGKGALFRIDADGRVDQLHAIDGGYFTALFVDGSGDLFAAAGANGRVYEVKPDRTLATAWSFPERQVLALALSGPHPAVGTGDSGALYAIDWSGAGGAGEPARWFSRVLDAGGLARFGALRATTAGDVKIETRSGSTAKPDRSWTDWQAPAAEQREGDDQRRLVEGKVRSPPGRYLQLRATFGKQARLFDVAVWYAPQNLRARVTEVTVGEEPATGIAKGARPAAGKPRSPIVKVRWKVEQPDDDELAFRVYYRQEGEPTWKPIGDPAADPILGKEVDWNTELVPDGSYLVRVVASDERVHPRGESLEHELVTSPYVVDNRRPEVQQLAARSSRVGGATRVTVTGVARDVESPIADLAASVDGGEMQPLAPRDRLFDDKVEEFSIELPDGLTPGAHSVVVRATDEADNVGLGQILVRVDGGKSR